MAVDQIAITVSEECLPDVCAAPPCHHRRGAEERTTAASGWDERQHDLARVSRHSAANGNISSECAGGNGGAGSTIGHRRQWWGLPLIAVISHFKPKPTSDYHIKRAGHVVRYVAGYGGLAGYYHIDCVVQGEEGVVLNYQVSWLLAWHPDTMGVNCAVADYAVVLSNNLPWRPGRSVDESSRCRHRPTREHLTVSHNHGTAGGADHVA